MDKRFLKALKKKTDVKVDGSKVTAIDGAALQVLVAAKKSALVVDEVEGRQQVVIKSIDTHYPKVDGVTGATMLGSGEVALILDVPGILKKVLTRNR